ncbi:bed zinc family dimerization isoform 1 [Hordeum vulgare]|nr:bed zinc family dimerization isoform 1 [Hordeum vulgare]
MLGCCLYFKEALQWYSERDSIFKLNFWPSEEEWAKVSHMYQFLEVFFKVTTVFSGTKYPTANLYFMNVYLVHTAIIEATDGINSYMGPMLFVMRAKFMKYWSDYSVFLSCAVVLDPRIKFKFLAYSYSKLYEEDDANRRIADVRSTLTYLFNGYGSVLPVHDNLAKTSMSSTCGLGAFSDYDQYVENTSSHEEKSELELYLAEPVKRLNENIDILDYWSKSAARYPQLARLARDILVVPVSSVASESAFSLNNKRKAEMVELDDDENSSSDEEECNIPILYSCQLLKFNTYFRAYS